LLILFLNRKLIVPVIIFAILLRPISWSYLILTHNDLQHLIGWFPFGCFHSLGFGALLAYFIRKKTIPSKHASLFLLFIVILYIGLLNIKNYNLSLILLADFFPPLINTTIILVSITSSSCLLNFIFNIKPIRYLGKISYGLYVIHPFISYGLIYVFHYYGHEFHLFADKFQILIYFCITVALAALSWELFEKRINNFKKYFAYINKSKISTK